MTLAARSEGSHTDCVRLGQNAPTTFESETGCSRQLMLTTGGTMSGEPDLEEVLNDPIVRLLMASDGVEIEDLRRLISSVLERMRA